MSARRWRGFHGHAATSVVTENGAPSRRVLVGEAEVVDQLFDAHRVGWWQRAPIEEAPNVRVRRRVDVDGERRERIVADAVEAVLVDLVVGLGVELYRRGHRCLSGCHRAERASDAHPFARRWRCGRHDPDRAAHNPRWRVCGHLRLRPVGLGPRRPHQREAHGRRGPVTDHLDAHRQRLKSRHEGTDFVDACHDFLEAKAAVGAGDRRPLDARADAKVDGRTGDRSPCVVHDDARQDAGRGGICDLQGTDGDQADGHETDKNSGQDQTHDTTSARRRRLGGVRP